MLYLLYIVCLYFLSVSYPNREWDSVREIMAEDTSDDSLGDFVDSDLTSLVRNIPVESDEDFDWDGSYFTS